MMLDRGMNQPHGSSYEQKKNPKLSLQINVQCVPKKNISMIRGNRMA